MRKTILLAISMTALGCNASRHAVRSDGTTAVETVATAAVTATGDMTERTRTTTYVDCNEETVTETTVFDTSLPVDPATGTPPVRVRTVQRRRTATGTTQNVSTDRRDSLTLAADSREDERLESRRVSETSRRGLNPLQRALCVTGAVAVLLGILWILRRFRRI